MKIIAIADTHGEHWKVKLPKGDILIHAGDCTSNGSFESFVDFIRWFKGQTSKHKIFIAGNHDAILDKQYNLVKDIILNSGCIYLENNFYNLEGLRIYGSPITPTFNDWFFMANRGEDIKKYWDKIPTNIDVLITHGPLIGVLDAVPLKYGEHHLGCEELRKRIFDIQPKIHICGHIHEGYGKIKFENTLCINASVLNRQYELTNEPQTIII